MQAQIKKTFKTHRVMYGWPGPNDNRSFKYDDDKAFCEEKSTCVVISHKGERSFLK